MRRRTSSVSAGVFRIDPLAPHPGSQTHGDSGRMRRGRQLDVRFGYARQFAGINPLASGRNRRPLAMIAVQIPTTQNLFREAFRKVQRAVCTNIKCESTE